MKQKKMRKKSRKKKNRKINQNLAQMKQILIIPKMKKIFLNQILNSQVNNLINLLIYYSRISKLNSLQEKKQLIK